MPTKVRRSTPLPHHVMVVQRDMACTKPNRAPRSRTYDAEGSQPHRLSVLTKTIATLHRMTIQMPGANAATRRNKTAWTGRGSNNAKERQDRTQTENDGPATHLCGAVLLRVHDLSLERLLALEARQARPRVGAGADADAVETVLGFHRLLQKKKKRWKEHSVNTRESIASHIQSHMRYSRKRRTRTC